MILCVGPFYVGKWKPVTSTKHWHSGSFFFLLRCLSILERAEGEGELSSPDSSESLEPSQIKGKFGYVRIKLDLKVFMHFTFLEFGMILLVCKIEFSILTWCSMPYEIFKKNWFRRICLSLVVEHFMQKKNVEKIFDIFRVSAISY